MRIAYCVRGEGSKARDYILYQIMSKISGEARRHFRKKVKYIENAAVN